MDRENILEPYHYFNVKRESQLKSVHSQLQSIHCISLPYSKGCSGYSWAILDSDLYNIFFSCPNIIAQTPLLLTHCHPKDRIYT